tara:strand:+ start:684 stop:839 length:156 start_codon:yes stop_codon:yes gene_type:complete
MDKCYLGWFWDCETQEFKRWLETIEKNMTATKELQHRRKEEREGIRLEEAL